VALDKIRLGFRRARREPTAAQQVGGVDADGDNGKDNPPEPALIDAKDHSKLNQIRRFWWLTLDDPSSGKPAQYISILIMCTIVLSILNMTFASIPEGMYWVDVWSSNVTGEVFEGSLDTDVFPNATRNDSPRLTCDEVVEARTPYRQIEIFCISVFTAEYIVRAFASPMGPGYLRYFLGPANVIDLVSILPFYIELVFQAIGMDGGGNLDVLSVLRLIRLTRITRIFKMSKNFQGLTVLAITFQKSAAALTMLFLFMLIFSIVFATLMYTVESGDYDDYRKQYVRPDGSASPFESIPVTVWWTVVTMCTVGYGDQYPVTSIGKLVAILAMFCGLIVLSLPITIIGANFHIEYRNLAQRLRREEQDKLRMAPEEEGDTTDAIHLIHELIDQSHQDLTNKVHNAIIARENLLRLQIKQVLAAYNSSIASLSTPLDVLKQPVSGSSPGEGTLGDDDY